MLQSGTKEHTSNMYEMNKSHRHNIEWNSLTTKIASTVWFHLWDVQRQSKLTDDERVQNTSKFWGLVESEKGQESTCLGAGIVLYLIPNGDYMDKYTYKHLHAVLVDWVHFICLTICILPFDFKKGSKYPHMWKMYLRQLLSV